MIQRDTPDPPARASQLDFLTMMHKTLLRQSAYDICSKADVPLIGIESTGFLLSSTPENSKINKDNVPFAWASKNGSVVPEPIMGEEEWDMAWLP